MTEKAGVKVPESEGSIRWLEASERSLRMRIEDKLSFDGLLPTRCDEFDIRGLRPSSAINGFGVAASYHGGDRTTGLPGRIAFWERLDERTKDLFPRFWEIKNAGVTRSLVEKLSVGSIQEREEQLIDLLTQRSGVYLDLAFQKIPDLKGRILRVYGLAACYNLLPANYGLPGFIWDRERFNDRELLAGQMEFLRLFLGMGDKIPKRTLTRFVRSGVVFDSKYDFKYLTIDFESVADRLFFQQICQQNWKQAREIASLRAAVYRKYPGLFKDDYDHPGESTVWQWIADNFDTLRADIEFISGRPVSEE